MAEGDRKSRSRGSIAGEQQRIGNSLQGSSVEVGSPQRRLAWPLREDGTRESGKAQIFPLRSPDALEAPGGGGERERERERERARGGIVRERTEGDGDRAAD
jgi:hypothetical protein